MRIRRIFLLFKKGVYLAFTSYFSSKTADITIRSIKKQHESLKLNEIKNSSELFDDKISLICSIDAIQKLFDTPEEVNKIYLWVVT